jgi:bacterial/archaeal transporter family-2 protein
LSPGSAAAVALCAIGGLGGAVQAAIMGRFGERIGVVEAFAFSTLVTAGISLAALLIARQSLAGYADGLRSPVWLWTAALMSAIIVAALTFASPRIGTTATIAILVAGNLVMAAAIDQFGWFGIDKIPLAWPRVLGLVLLALGAALTLWRR